MGLLFREISNTVQSQCCFTISFVRYPDHRIVARVAFRCSSESGFEGGMEADLEGGMGERFDRGVEIVDACDDTGVPTFF